MNKLLFLTFLLVFLTSCSASIGNPPTTTKTTYTTPAVTSTTYTDTAPVAESTTVTQTSY